AIVLKVTGTSTFTLVSTRDNPGKAPVVVQTKKDAKDLKPKQVVTVVYTMIGEDKVLLSAVWQGKDKQRAGQEPRCALAKQSGALIQRGLLRNGWWAGCGGAWSGPSAGGCPSVS